jgi:dienelactone hydrolase
MMMTIRDIVAALICVMVTTVVPCAMAQVEPSEEQMTTSENQVALPSAIGLEVPASDVPADVAGFAGVWGGDKWEGIVPNALIVKRLGKDGSAEVIFAYGDRGKNQSRGWVEVTGKVADGTLSLVFPDGTMARYTPTPDHRLLGSYTNATGSRYFVILAPIRSTDPAAIIAATGVSPVSEEVEFPLTSRLAETSGQTFQMRAELYRIQGDGRHPLIIFSGDTVTSDVLRTRPYLSSGPARYFIGLGYSVLVPQRKGMGGSEGPLMERHDVAIPERTQLESGLEDIDAAVTFMKSQPYVDPARIVVGGRHRGGFLAVVYAGHHQHEVAGVINDYGDWRINRDAWQRVVNNWNDFEASQLRKAGGGTKVPTLWIYGDSVTGRELDRGRQDLQVFAGAGGVAQLADTSQEEGSPLDFSPAKFYESLGRYLNGLGRN